MKTVLLDRKSWDLIVDGYGNIGVASDPYSQAQDAASAIRLFRGEAYYDTTRGVPYWNKQQPAVSGQILGAAPPPSYMKEKFVQAALTVPGVTAARCFLASIVGRLVQGQVQITNKSGQSAVTGF
jgi:hypothetical protein